MPLLSRGVARTVLNNILCRILNENILRKLNKNQGKINNLKRI
jgi:hypothetical protein